MLYPVSLVNPSQLCTPQASTSTILNYGPGNIYVYRNAAVNRIGAYDAVVGPGGTFQWPGGELWAVADAAGTTTNVLAGATAVNTGSTSISGVVTTTSSGSSGTTPSGPSTTARILGASSGYTGGNTASCTTPSSTQVGDLLIAYLNGASNAISTPTGWTNVFAGTSSSDINVGVWTRVATAADVNAGASYSFGGTGLSGSGYNADVVMVDVLNATGVGSIVELTLKAGNGSAQTTGSSASLVSGQTLLAFGSVQGGSQLPIWQLNGATPSDANTNQPNGTYGLVCRTSYLKTSAAGTVSASLTVNGTPGNCSVGGLLVPLT